MSAKRSKRPSKSGAIWRMTAEEATLAKKPRYNGYACGHGVHGDTKYNRAKTKRAWKANIQQEGARKGSFLFLGIRYEPLPAYQSEACCDGCLAAAS